MSDKFRFKIVIGVVVIAVVAAGWWIFKFPYRPELVYRVIPEDATVASRHICLKKRINLLCNVIKNKNITDDLGPDGQKILDVIDDPGIRKLVNIIGSKLLVTAYVPSMGGYGKSGYICGCWIGGVYSQLLRWGLLDRFFDDLTVKRFAGKRRVWFCEFPDYKEGYYLSFAVHEGVLTGCLSADKFGALYVSSRLNRQKPLASITKKLITENNSGYDDELIASVNLPNEIGQGQYHIYAAINKISEKEISLEIEGVSNNNATDLLKKYFPDSVVYDENDAKYVHVFNSKSAGILCALPASSISPLLDTIKIDRHGFWNGIMPLIDKKHHISIFACGDKYYGHVMRMKVPSLGLVLDLDKNVTGESAINKIVDKLNSSWGWGLIAIPDTKDRRIRILNSVRGGAFTALGSNERPAVAICGSSLLVLSNVDVLSKILKDYDNKGRNYRSLNIDQNSLLYGWSDLKQASDILGKSLAGYTLVSLLKKNGAKRRYDTKQLKMAIKALGMFDQLSVWVEPEESNAKLNAVLSL